MGAFFSEDLTNTKELFEVWSLEHLNASVSLIRARLQANAKAVKPRAVLAVMSLGFHAVKAACALTDGHADVIADLVAFSEHLLAAVAALRHEFREDTFLPLFLSMEPGDSCER